MKVQDRLRNRLINGRKFSEGLLKTFEKREDWMFRVHPTANHALWIVGHLSFVDNSILKMLSPADADDRAWLALFAPESEPSDDASIYPSTADLLAYFRERRVKAMELLERQTEESLAKPVPAGAPPIFSDIASVFEVMSFHEAMHGGQITVARQALRHARLVNFPRPAKTT